MARASIEMTKFAQKCGAEGALVIMPYYLIPHKRAVVNHFKKLREAVGDDFDIILYNNPRFLRLSVRADRAEGAGGAGHTTA